MVRRYFYIAIAALLLNIVCGFFRFSELLNNLVLLNEIEVIRCFLKTVFLFFATLSFSSKMRINPLKYLIFITVFMMTYAVIDLWGSISYKEILAILVGGASSWFLFTVFKADKISVK